MKKVLVTGANGFIGRHCLPLLLEKGYEVHAISTNELDSNLIHWHKADLLNLQQSSDLITKLKPSHLLHLAWDTTHGKYWSSLENFNWLQASVELLKAFQGNSGKRVVMAGTCAEYDWNYGLCSEGITPLVPATVYGTCKNSLEKVLSSFAHETGISAAWGRIFFAYGPNENIKRLIPYVITSLLKGKKAQCSSGNQIRDFLYVNDAAAAFVSLLETEVNGAFNIASGQPVILRDIINMIAEKLNVLDLIELGKLPNSSNDPAVLTADIRKISAATGWKPAYSLEEGIDETIKWWRDNL
jgi:nucleoside-diphosphate-sugar epimerase